MAHYPINLDLRGRKTVVVGGGSVAERKVSSLLEYGAQVTVVSPALTARLSEMAAAGLIQHTEGVYAPSALDGAFLVIAATDDREVNRAVYIESENRRIPVNVVDDPELCTFFASAVVRRGELTISVSTSGKGPALAQMIRNELECRYGPEYGELADLLGDLRDEVKARYSTMSERKAAYVRVLESEALLLLSQGKREEALLEARRCI